MSNQPANRKGVFEPFDETEQIRDKDLKTRLKTVVLLNLWRGKGPFVQQERVFTHSS